MYIQYIYIYIHNIGWFARFGSQATALIEMSSLIGMFLQDWTVCVHLPVCLFQCVVCSHLCVLDACSVSNCVNLSVCWMCDYHCNRGPCHEAQIKLPPRKVALWLLNQVSIPNSQLSMPLCHPSLPNYNDTNIIYTLKQCFTTTQVLQPLIPGFPSRRINAPGQCRIFLTSWQSGKSLQSFGRKETLRCKPCKEGQRKPVLLVDELFHDVDAEDCCFTVGDSGWTNWSDLGGLPDSPKAPT